MTTSKTFLTATIIKGRRRLLNSVLRMLARLACDGDTYVDVHQLPYCQSIKHADAEGQLSCYSYGRDRLCPMSVGELPIETLIVFEQAIRERLKQKEARIASRGPGR